LGVAEIDAEPYTNWLGNFENADIASDYAVANGIATQVVTAGGKITKVRSQHIWVQAAIDYFPSRGSKNRSADSWVDLDASFKQYEYSEGLDIAAVGGIDTAAISERYIDTIGTVNEVGFIQNLDNTEILEAQLQAEQAIELHIENNLTNLTMTDVIGGRRTITQEHPSLQGGLPYTIFDQGLTFGIVPNRLQNKAAVGFDGGRTVFPFAQVNNQKITLQFTPATQTDQDALNSLLPEGEIIDASQLPNRIPSYLIRVIPELSLNGEVFRQSSSMRLGDEINLSYQFSGPLATYSPYNYSVIAGSYLNVPLVAQSISPILFQKLLTKVERIREIIDSGEQPKIENLTGQEILSDLLYAGGLGYFGQYLNLSNILSVQQKGSTKLEFGYGSYGYEPNLNTFFGVPRAIESGGIGVNMLFTITAESQNGDLQSRNQLRFRSGLTSSALEHLTPEDMFSDQDNSVNALSAVKAIEIALIEGQRIYQIDSANVNSVMPQLNLDISVEDEIRDSVNAGRIVVTHTENVSVTGFTGSGYLILDPATLAGSYKISTGANGAVAFISGASLGLLVGLQAPLLTTGVGALATVVIFFNAILPLYLYQMNVLRNAFEDEDDPTVLEDALNCYRTGFAVTAIIAASFSAIAAEKLGVLLANLIGGTSRMVADPPQISECF